MELNISNQLVTNECPHIEDIYTWRLIIFAIIIILQALILKYVQMMMRREKIEYNEVEKTLYWTAISIIGIGGFMLSWIMGL